MSIFSKFFFTLFGSSILAWLRDFVSRVTEDGGTLSDQGHTKDVYAYTNPYDPTLILSCDSGKATTLYSLFAFDDVDDFELRVVADGGTNESTRHNVLVAQHLWRNNLGNSASLIVPCASYKAGRLYAYQPTLEPDTTLLDYYTGAAAAYSLRSLSASTTNVVKVRRSGDNAELDFTATEVSDGTLASWVTAGGGTEDGLVTTWYDQSGNGNNATEVTAANQPKIVDSGSLVTENGKPAIYKQGLGVALPLTSNLVNGANFLYSLVHGPFSDFQKALDGAYLGPRDGATYRHDYDSSTVNQFQTTSLNTVANQSLVVSQRVGTTSGSVYTNGTITTGGVVTTGANVSTSHNAIFEGATSKTGKIQEIVFWDFDQSANRTGIEGNINDYYNIYP